VQLGRLLILNERDPRNPRAGGAEIHVFEIFGRLARRGHRVTALAASFPGSAARETVDGIDVRRLGRVPLYYPRAARACAREASAGRVDVVVECLNKLPYYAPVYARVPVLAVCHHLFGETAFLQVAWPVAAAVWLAEKPIPRLYRGSTFVAISDSSRDDLVARGVKPEDVHVIPCGIRRPSVPVRVPVAQRPRRVVYVGRLEAYKRVDVLLRAMASLRERLPDAETVVIGRGSQQALLEALARELGIADRTRFAGFVSDAERDALLADARVCVCPSVKEGWGLAVIESNAVGTPVVASDAPGLRDSVRDGETGFLVPVDDVAAFAARIAELLLDDERAERMSRLGEAWSRRFDWDQVADRVESIVYSLLADGASAPARRAATPREIR
jgi:glycosyltransferase involved in cell wall biosynthesis